MSKTPIIVCGALGRMGSATIELALGSPHLSIEAGIASKGQQKPRHWTFPLLTGLSGQGTGVIIDFSHHSKLAAHAAFALEHALPFVLCTTGHDAANLQIMREAATRIPFLYAPNTSIMANVLTHMTALASRIPGVQAHITDIHHRHKQDAPSGTALNLKAALGPIDASITSIRAADVIGEHRVHFFKENEQLELIHRVSSRAIFAEGALIAAQFLSGQGPGLYSMSDVLNLNFAIENRPCVEAIDYDKK